jgi:hypothetical protein
MTLIGWISTPARQFRRGFNFALQNKPVPIVLINGYLQHKIRICTSNVLISENPHLND